MSSGYMDLTEYAAPECTRGPDGTHNGEVFARTSRSGLTTAWICQGHAEELEAELDAVAQRYPEINHPEGCECYGCTGGDHSEYCGCYRCSEGTW